MMLRPGRLLVALALTLALAGSVPARQAGDTQGIFREPKTAAEYFQRVMAATRGGEPFGPAAMR